MTMLRILTYHRVASPAAHPPLCPGSISATPEVFAQQIRFLSQSCSVLSMEEILKLVSTGGPAPRRAVAITFDDAYRDFAEFAWPILKQYRLPVTLFVPTAYPDHPERVFWWDRLFRTFVSAAQAVWIDTPIGVLPLWSARERRASLRKLSEHVKALPHNEAMQMIDEVCKRLGEELRDEPSVLGWEELRRLAREGVTLGAHTRTHVLLNRVAPEQALQEITGSQLDVQREIGYSLPIFCYPGGAHDDGIVQMLRGNGFKLAVTTLDGFNDLKNMDPLRLHRTNITMRTTLPILRLRLLRPFALVDRWRHSGLRGRVARSTGSRSL